MQRLLRITGRTRRPMLVLAGALFAMATITNAVAQEPGIDETLQDLAAAIDGAWLMIAAFLVFFMQAGFAMVEAGFVRSKNTTNILMKNMLDACFGAIAFWAVGWAFAYGTDGNGFIGAGQFFLNGFDGYTDWIFQFAFAATAATIVSGALAERTKFSAYLVYSVFITAFIYPVVVHWGWDTAGWMSAFRVDSNGEPDPFMANGYIDFAGSGIVHAVGGLAGLMGAIAVGPRLGKYGKDGSFNPIPGHNITIAVLGMFILWFGWYGFNPGSTLGLTGGLAALAAKVAVTTTLSAAAGAVTVVIVSKIMTGKYDMGLTVNGVLGGLVGITAGCATLDPWAALVVGIVAGLVVMGGIRLLDNLKVDDPVGAVSVHGFAGIWGVLAVGLFSSESNLEAAGYADPSSYGLLLGGGIDQFVVQLIGILAIIGWVLVTAGILFFGIKFTMGMRVSEAEEIRGLDVDEHGLEAYPEFAASPLDRVGMTGSAGAGGGGAG
jgi:Amt family ammonium transporter